DGPPRPRPIGLGEPARQRRASDEVHRNEDLIAVYSHIMDGHHIGVLELGEGLGLAEEAASVAGRWRETARPNELQRDVSAQFSVARPEHLPHSAGTEKLSDLVAIDEVTRSDSGRRSCLALRKLARGRSGRLRRATIGCRQGIAHAGRSWSAGLARGRRQRLDGRRSLRSTVRPAATAALITPELTIRGTFVRAFVA